MIDYLNHRSENYWSYKLTELISEFTKKLNLCTLHSLKCRVIDTYKIRFYKLIREIALDSCLTDNTFNCISSLIFTQILHIESLRE